MGEFFRRFTRAQAELFRKVWPEAGLVLLAFALLMTALFSACPASQTPVLSAASGDMRPPALIRAGPDGAAAFVVEFDEQIQPVERSCSIEPGSSLLTAGAEGQILRIAIEPPQQAGLPYTLGGEAKDATGNVTRFLFTFTGWNENPPSLRLNEVQPGKNSSTLAPHRDFVEFVALSDGNLGGEVIEWTSSVKNLEWRFPACEVQANQVIVVHFAPEGIPAEKNELTANLAESGGIDSSPTGRDFWVKEGPLPDENALILVRKRANEAPMDGIFYANKNKSDAISVERISSRLEELQAAGIWKASVPALWEDAFLWTPSVARPLQRVDRAIFGVEAWLVGAAGSQSAGLLFAPAPLNLSKADKAAKVKKTSASSKKAAAAQGLDTANAGYADAGGAEEEAGPDLMAQGDP